MRRSLTISVLVHAAILAAAFVVLPNPEEFKVTNQEAIPVEIVSIENDSKRLNTVKSQEKKVVEKPAPKPAEVVKPAEPAPEVAPEVKTAVKEASAPPEPKPPEPKEKPKPEAKPEPAPKPEDMAELLKKIEPEEKKPEEKQAEAKPEKKPEPKPVEKKPEKKKEQKKFNPDDIAAFLNKTDDKRTAPQKPQTEAGTPNQAEFNVSGADDKMSATIGDLIQQKLIKCWTVPPGAREAQISVKIRFFLNADGTVSGLPQVLNSNPDPLFATTAQSAQSAVMDCQPYELPQDRYDLWQDNTVNFNPNMMFPS